MDDKKGACREGQASFFCPSSLIIILDTCRALLFFLKYAYGISEDKVDGLGDGEDDGDFGVREDYGQDSACH